MSDVNGCLTDLDAMQELLGAEWESNQFSVKITHISIHCGPLN